MSEYRLFKVIRTDESKYFDIEYVRDVVTCEECKHWDDRRKDEWWSEEGACYLTSRLGHATYRNHDDFCSYGKVSEKPTSSEKPNNCEHITEDGVTCAKYPACDDCLDNPLNKVKGSERLVKGSEKPNNSTIEDCSDVGKE